MRNRIRILAIAALMLGVTVLADPGKTTPVRVSGLPKELVALVKKRFPNGKILRAKKSAPEPMDEGGNMWLTVKDDKKEIHVNVSCANAFYQIITISRDLAPAEVPGYVLDVVRAKYPQDKVESAQEVQNGLIESSPPEYSLRVKTADNQELMIWLTPVFKQDDEGRTQPIPGRGQIESESPVTKAEGKKP